MIITDLTDLGLALAFAIVALGVTVFLRLRTKAAGRRNDRRERD